jgi:serine/threonine-protein kinase RsbW
MDIGVRLREVRRLRGISLRNLAKKVGVSASFISQVEQNKCQPSLDTLRRISEALDVTTSYLLEPEGHEISPHKEVAEIRLPNRLKYLSTLADFLKGVCQKHGVPTKDIENILLAVDEASTNVIKYAYQVGPLNYFKVRVSFDRDLVQIDLLDQGTRFNPLENPPPDKKELAGGEEDLGMGIYVMKKVMDNIRYRYSPNEGNHLTLIKRISQSKGNGQ